MQALEEARLTACRITLREAAMEKNNGAQYFISNPQQQLTARFLDGAIRLGSGQGGIWTATLGLEGSQHAVPRASGNRVEYAHGSGLKEWFVNCSEGIEHGFTVSKRPVGQDTTGELRLDMRLEGLLAKAVDEDGKALEFIDPESRASCVRYDGLKAWDAHGKALVSRMEASPSGFTLVVSDAGAVYPLTIDPLITSLESKLEPIFTGDGSPKDFLGSSVAIAGDTAVVGVPGDDTAAGEGTGSAYVFIRTASSWSLQYILMADDANAGDELGGAVSISGTTIIVGARFGDSINESDTGSAYVFVRNGDVCSQQAKLIPNDPAYDDWFGASVSIDGETLVVGSPRHDSLTYGDVGSAYVFVRSGTTWTQQAQLTASNGEGVDNFGNSVSISGTTILVGAEGADYSGYTNTGSAYVYLRTGTSWSQQAILTPRDDVIYFDGAFGVSVALSGNTALIGAEGESSSGRAHVFTRSGTTWTRQSMLVPADSTSSDYFGTSVALSGNTAVVGSDLNDSTRGDNTGSAYVFFRNGSSWSQQAKLESTLARAEDQFGYSVAVSADTVIVGAPFARGVIPHEFQNDSDAGSAFVFSRSGSTWSLQQELNGGNGAISNGFGSEVEIEENTAVVGTPGEDTPSATGAGAAYVFTKSGDTWNYAARLIADDYFSPHDPNPMFGSSISISGNTILVGAWNVRGGEGRAYVFTNNGGSWQQQAILSASTGLAHFGISVAVENDRALVGAPLERNARGAAYVFERSGTNWTQQTKLIAADETAYSSFGVAVDMSGDTAAIGSDQKTIDSAVAAGCVYIFTTSNGVWSQQQKLTATDATAYHEFGGELAISGETILIGAKNTYYNPPVFRGTGYGSAYIFARSGATWTQQAKLLPAVEEFNDYFGSSVALDGPIAMVGSPLRDRGAESNLGEVFIYRRSGSTWSQETSIVSDISTPSQSFGSAIALTGYTALVGASSTEAVNPYTGIPAQNSGTAYFFHLEVTAEPTPRELFDSAMLAANQFGNNALPSAIPYHDGVENLLKYAFNMNLSAADVRELIPSTGTAGLPLITLDRSQATPRLRFEFLRRKNSGLIYTPLKGTELNAGSWVGLSSPVPDVMQSIDSEWERVVYFEDVDLSTQPRYFGRVEVVLPE
ncbi:MAG: FG-GAP repeat protein [Akkermansiaceae bacterium]|nr:FG-GAP repeat protein [Akkermansiaceae bacterium]